MKQTNMNEIKFTQTASQRQERPPMTQPASQPSRQVISPDQDTPIRYLIGAVIEQAYADAHSPSPAKRAEARQWLLDEGQAWIDAISDIHPDHVRQWLDGRKRRRAARRDRSRWKAYQ
jgi:hypothetical protein